MTRPDPRTTDPYGVRAAMVRAAIATRVRRGLTFPTATVPFTGRVHGPARPPAMPGDVVRARRYGNRTRANYVVTRTAATHPAMGADVFAIVGHREHGSGRDAYMVLDARGAHVIRSYRTPCGCPWYVVHGDGYPSTGTCPTCGGVVA